MAESARGSGESGAGRSGRNSGKSGAGTSKTGRSGAGRSGSVRQQRNRNEGKLRIGNQWNAIRIIALSQSNPLKAIAEFVENSIDARAENITIVRGKERGRQYLKVSDDGRGIDDLGYVATHIGDSIKRKLKEQGESGLQGEFGIGLLSFWSVGEELVLTSAGENGGPKRLRMVKDSPSYKIEESRELFERRGTTVKVAPLLPGIKMLAGDKIQAYLASELRDRISRSGVKIKVIDRSARKELTVEPRRFTGTLLHELPPPRSPHGEIYTELYLCDPSLTAGVGLHRSGTRVIANIAELDAFRRHPWTSGYLEGIIDVPFLQLTPGTRSGVIHDEAFESLVHALAPLENALTERIEEQRRAEEEAASRSMLKRITKALTRAMSMLPSEDYGWLSAKTRSEKSTKGAGEGAAGASTGDAEDHGAGTADGTDGGTPDGTATGGTEAEAPGVAVGEPREAAESEEEQPPFYEFPGPLYRVEVRPVSARVHVGESRTLRAIPRDKSRRVIDEGVEIAWEITQGAGSLSASTGEFCEYRAPTEPELARVQAIARSGETECSAEATLTVTAELLPGGAGAGGRGRRGLPGYTYRYQPGELWRSRYDAEAGIITVNSGHPDFVYAARQNASKLRYVANLFAKEIVLANFPGASREQLLERMVELNLYMESNLR